MAVNSGPRLLAVVFDVSLAVASVQGLVMAAVLQVGTVVLPVVAFLLPVVVVVKLSVAACG